MKFAHVDKDGRVLAFYDSAVHTKAQIPAGAFEITEKIWRDWMAKQHILKWDLSTKKLVSAPALDRRTMNMVRGLRNELLASSDWTQLLDAPLTTAKVAAWATYRAKLRDVPKVGKVSLVVFPKEPLT